MFRNLINNLSKNQKIGALVLLQIVVVIVLVLLVQSFTAEKNHVDIENETEYSEEMPNEAKKYIEDNIWQVVKNKVVKINRNDVDVVIREGTYKEVESEDGVKVEFIVDIDSLKQSYIVRTGWTNDKSVIYEVIVDCPPQSKMKYSDTVCYGAYNDTYSLDLYLPHMVYPEGHKVGDNMAPDYMITGDESAKTLDIMVSKCNVEGFKKDAWDYLNTIPIDFSDWTVNYEINSTDVGC